MDNIEEISHYNEAVHLASLINKIQENQLLTDQEQLLLNEWLGKDPRHSILYEQLMDRKKVMTEMTGIDDSDTKEAVTFIFDRLGLTLPAKQRRIPVYLRRLSVAAIFLLLAAGAWWFFAWQQTINSIPGDEPPSIASLKNDIPPGGDKAILTLADGSAITLDSAANGLLSRQGNTKVIKSGSGKLAYEITGSSRPPVSGKITYNMITTPRGGQYQIQLPDGSKAWLNAGSSLRFPTAFSGKSREVQITGEVYFEVASDKNKPFYVTTNGQSVEVLGTYFNINAYPDEPVMKTTLLEGSVRVRKGQATAILNPGQQAQIPNISNGAGDPGKIRLVDDANLQEVMAWKNGLFYMTRADIGTIMRQLARWYDVQVEFEGAAPAGHITGKVPRNTSLSTVLKVLEASGVHFRVEGKKIFVTP